MHKDGKQYLKGSIKQKFCYPFRTSKDDSKYPCNHPKYNNGHKNRECIKYKSISTTIAQPSMIHQIILNYTIQRELNQNATIHDLRILILKIPLLEIFLPYLT